jgi:hypothetical protein
VVIPVVALGTRNGLSLHTASDSLILTLPMSYGASWLTVLVFLGGLSAATAMVVVASTALATMISNDIAAPIDLAPAAGGWLEPGPARAVGAAGTDLYLRTARFYLLPIDRRLDQPGRVRHAVVRRRGAVRAGNICRACTGVAPAARACSGAC